MILPNKLEIGDTIGVVAPSNPIINENIEELNRAKKIIEEKGFKVKFSENLFSNTNGYSSSAKEKADDINKMFSDKEVKMIWCAKGGQNSNSVLDYLDYEKIKNNPKIICGYSDITSLTNAIYQKTGLVTFSSTNFKTIATDETDYSLNEVLSRFVDGSLKLGNEDDLEITNPTGTHIHMSIKSDIISLDEKKTNKIIQIYYLQNKVLISDFGKKKMFEINSEELNDSKNDIIYFSFQNVRLLLIL